MVLPSLKMYVSVRFFHSFHPNHVLLLVLAAEAQVLSLSENLIIGLFFCGLWNLSYGKCFLMNTALLPTFKDFMGCQPLLQLSGDSNSTTKFLQMDWLSIVAPL